MGEEDEDDFSTMLIWILGMMIAILIIAILCMGFYIWIKSRQRKSPRSRSERTRTFLRTNTNSFDTVESVNPMGTIGFKPVSKHSIVILVIR